MKFTFKVPIELEIKATEVNSAEHAVHRVRKFLRENCFVIQDDAQYRPDKGQVWLDFNEMTTALKVSEEYIVNPPTWFSEDERIQILDWCENVIPARTIEKLKRALDQEAE